MKTITVKKVGEDRGFCREYFKSTEGRFYAKSTHPAYAERIDWYACDYNGAEPSYPINLNETNFIESN